MALESSITKSILDHLNGLPNCTAEKVQGNSTASGRADINGCFRGRSFRIEVKTPDHKNVASKKQERNLEKWRKAGSVVMVAYSLKAVKKVFPGTPSIWGVDGWTFEEENGCWSWVKIPRISQ